VGDAEVVLSPKEFDLLALLAEDPGAVVSRQTILEEVWDPHWYGPTKTVDVHVASLRRKLGNPDWIETVRRVGLRLGNTAMSASPARGDPGATPESVHRGMP
jgi:DNA-binding response OmpR family regulator